MAKKKNNLRSYNAVIKRAKKMGLSRKQATQVYRELKEKLGRQPRAKDFDEHPRIVQGIMEEKVTQGIDDFIDALEATPGNERLRALYDKHKGERGFNFELENNILKVSISTKKTRGKKFSIRG